MIRKQNRMKVKRAKKALYWCGCDRITVSPGERCPECGHIAMKGKRKFKKMLTLQKKICYSQHQ